MILNQDETNFIKGILEWTQEMSMDAESEAEVRRLLERIKTEPQCEVKKICPNCGQTVNNLYVDDTGAPLCADCVIDLFGFDEMRDMPRI